MSRNIVDFKSLRNSQENIMTEFDLVKLQFCDLNTATLLKTSPQILSGIKLEWPSSLESEL